MTQHYSSLRNVLTANFVLVAALPILFIGLTGLYTLTSNMQQEIANKNLLLAKSIAGEVERFLEEPLRVLKQIEYITAQQKLLPDTMTSYLESILTNYSFFETLMLTDLQGTVQSLAPYREDFLHINMSGHEAFQASIASGQPRWSPTFISLQTNQPTIIISFPTTDGMIIGYLNLAALKAIIEKVTIGQFGYAVIIDHNGTVIAHPKQAYTSQRLNVQNIPLIHQGLRGYEGTSGYRFEGVEKLGSVARISSIHWLVVIAQTKKEAYASITKITILLWSGMGAAIIFALFSAMFILQKTLKPLVQLTNYSQKIAAGEYEVLTWHKGYQEIEELARSFNAMGRAIESREQALLQREKQYRILFNSINDALFVNSIVDKTLGPFIEVNRVACQRLGYTREELLQCAPFDISEPATMHMSRLTAKIIAERHILFEHILVCKNGQQFPVEINAHLFELNGQTAVLSTARDISERKHAEEAMHRLRNLLSNTIDSMPSILIGVTQDGTVVQWNRKAEEETDITADEAFGQQLSDIFPQLAGKMSALGLALRNQHLQHNEKVVWKQGKTTRFVDITIYPLLEIDTEGAVIRVDDVTERVRMEEIMLQSEKMLTVSGLSAGMAHEINNPLGIIMQAMQNMVRRLSPDSPRNQLIAQECGVSLEQVLAYFERQHILHYVHGAQEAGQRASKIVSNMLSFSRKGEPDKTPIDINQLLDESIELAMSDYDLKKKYDFKQIEILREYDPTLPAIPCIRIEIEQVFLNVLKNAVQAFSGTHHTSRKPSIRICTMRDDWSLIIRIEDNGIGMDANTRKRVFEPFYTTKPVGEGTGLGLSVSYFIIETHHEGEISIDSGPDKGTILTIHLPL